jgi:hypothetical protein
MQVQEVNLDFQVLEAWPRSRKHELCADILLGPVLNTSIRSGVVKSDPGPLQPRLHSRGSSLVQTG